MDALDSALRELRAEQVHGVPEWKPSEGEADAPEVLARRRTDAYRASLEFDLAHPGWRRSDPVAS